MKNPYPLSSQRYFESNIVVKHIKVYNISRCRFAFIKLVHLSVYFPFFTGKEKVSRIWDCKKKKIVRFLTSDFDPVFSGVSLSNKSIAFKYIWKEHGT